MKRQLAALFTVALVLAACSKDPEPVEPITPVTPEEENLDIPMGTVRISTVGNVAIDSRDEYKDAYISFSDVTGALKGLSGGVKGRGNSSWWNTEKKSYRIRLDEQAEPFGRSANRDWCLIANSFDKTMLRNKVAFKMSEMSRLDYTPGSQFVELYLNNAYQGVYLLTDKVETAKSRVNATYLLEFDCRAEETDTQFNSAHEGPIVIRDPNELTEDEFSYVKKYVCHADDVLFSDSYTASTGGYLDYMDMESFVDWYLINEIAKNNDAILFTSCYMHFDKGDKLKMGPVWDFDIGFGNVNYNDNEKTEGFWITKAAWYGRMVTDPAFMAEVKERFNYFYSKRQELYDYIDKYAEYLEPYITKDDEKWHTLAKMMWANNEVFETYGEYITSLKNWMEARFQWMYKQYNK